MCKTVFAKWLKGKQICCSRQIHHSSLASYPPFPYVTPPLLQADRVNSEVYDIGWVYVLGGHSEHSCYCCSITRLRVTLAIHSCWPLNWLAVLVVTMLLGIRTTGTLSFAKVMIQKCFGRNSRIHVMGIFSPHLLFTAPINTQPVSQWQWRLES